MVRDMLRARVGNRVFPSEHPVQSILIVAVLFSWKFIRNSSFLFIAVVRDMIRARVWNRVIPDQSIFIYICFFFC